MAHTLNRATLVGSALHTAVSAYDIHQYPRSGNDSRCHLAMAGLYVIREGLKADNHHKSDARFI